MLRILIAVAALYVFTGLTRPARADESRCIPIDKVLETRLSDAMHLQIVNGDQLDRAVKFFNDMPGDKLVFDPDAVILAALASGALRLIYTHEGLACDTYLVPRQYAPLIKAMILGASL